jgi:hypothetical protein
MPPLPGPLVAVGGGGMPPAVLAAVVALVGKPGFSAVVLPQASIRGRSSRSDAASH